MAMPSCDPRQGGSCSNCVANKFCCVIIGWVQLVFWVLGLLTIIFKPSTVSTIVKNMDTTATVMAGFISLFCVAFSVILLIGLHKDKRVYITTYCVYVVVYLVLLVISFIVNLFLQPQNIDFKGFFSVIVGFFLNLMFFFVVRSYYLITYCSIRQQFSNPPKFNKPSCICVL